MSPLGRLVVVGLLLGATACQGRLALSKPETVKQDTLRSVVSSATIAGPPDAVFALITTARFWPEWHPATQAVGGVTERPYRLGDRISERGRIGPLDFQVVWRVAEYAPPSRVVLQAEGSPTRITYTFQALVAGTRFVRALEYRPDVLPPRLTDPETFDRLMRQQSEQAVTQLKALVEKILRAEIIPAP